MNTEEGSVRMPTTRSATAMFTINQLNGVRRFLFGSNTTARTMSTFPRMFKIQRMAEALVVSIDNASGAEINRQYFSK